MTKLESMEDVVDAIKENKQILKVKDGFGVDTEQTEPLKSDELLRLTVGHALFCLESGFWFLEDKEAA